MNKVLKFGDYCGSVDVDLDAKVLYGRVLFIEDVVTYEASSITGLEKAFRAAVNDYVATCRKLNEQPETPFKGTFNVRVGPELHRKAATLSRLQGVTLNEFIVRAVEQFTKGASSSKVQHDHHHYYHMAQDVAFELTESAEQPSNVTAHSEWQGLVRPLN